MNENSQIYIIGVPNGIVLGRAMERLGEAGMTPRILLVDQSQIPNTCRRAIIALDPEMEAYRDTMEAIFWTLHKHKVEVIFTGDSSGMELKKRLVPLALPEIADKDFVYIDSPDLLSGLHLSAEPKNMPTLYQCQNGTILFTGHLPMDEPLAECVCDDELGFFSKHSNVIIFSSVFSVVLLLLSLIIFIPSNDGKPSASTGKISSHQTGETQAIKDLNVALEKAHDAASQAEKQIEKLADMKDVKAIKDVVADVKARYEDTKKAQGVADGICKDAKENEVQEWKARFAEPVSTACKCAVVASLKVVEVALESGAEEKEWRVWLEWADEHAGSGKAKYGEEYANAFSSVIDKAADAVVKHKDDGKLELCQKVLRKLVEMGSHFALELAGNDKLNEKVQSAYALTKPVDHTCPRVQDVMGYRKGGAKHQKLKQNADAGCETCKGLLAYVHTCADELSDEDRKKFADAGCGTCQKKMSATTAPEPAAHKCPEAKEVMGYKPEDGEYKELKQNADAGCETCKGLLAYVHTCADDMPKEERQKFADAGCDTCRGKITEPPAPAPVSHTCPSEKEVFGYRKGGANHRKLRQNADAGCETCKKLLEYVHTCDDPNMTQAKREQFARAGCKKCAGILTQKPQAPAPGKRPSNTKQQDKPRGKPKKNVKVSEEEQKEQTKRESNEIFPTSSTNKKRK